MLKALKTSLQLHMCWWPNHTQSTAAVHSALRKQFDHHNALACLKLAPSSDGTHMCLQPAPSTGATMGSLPTGDSRVPAMDSASAQQAS